MHCLTRQLFYSGSAAQPFCRSLIPATHAPGRARPSSWRPGGANGRNCWQKRHLFLVSDHKKGMYEASREKDGKIRRKENTSTKWICPLSKNDQSNIKVFHELFSTLVVLQTRSLDPHSTPHFPKAPWWRSARATSLASTVLGCKHEGSSGCRICISIIDEHA